MFDSQNLREEGANRRGTTEEPRSNRVADVQRTAGNAAVQLQSRSSGLQSLPGMSVSGAAPLMRSGNVIPAGAVVERVDGGSADAIFGALNTAAYGAAKGYANSVNWSTSPVAGAIENAFASNLASRAIRINWQSPSVGFGGKAINWTGNIMFRIGGATPVTGGGTAPMGGSTGGTGTAGTQNNASRTDSASATGSAGGHEGAPGGSATAGTSSTTSSQESGGSTVNSGGAMGGNRNMVRYQAPLMVDVSLHASPDFGGTDYINPWEWGKQAVTSIAFGDGNGSAGCGTLFYYVSNGIAPSGTP